ncbi:hypothetical protein [Candidatus Albibeggiatoa sp. nov. NOAA]|uniref:hypothetical protein n=1 Tax=Candidatus Albibeggiatoa sp. nov. NOAA TaxID=3162724 RepID=UPI0032FFE70D|nr:hypothetical protein [Thiotrichaceae bacterium]
MSTVTHGLLVQPIADELATRVQQIYVPQYGSDWANVTFNIDVKKFRFKPITLDSLDLKWSVQAAFCADIYILMTSNVPLSHASEILLNLKTNPIVITEPNPDNAILGMKAANFTLEPIGSHEQPKGLEILTVARFKVETGYLLERIDKVLL